MSDVTAMLVDDHRLLREALKRSLEPAGFRVVAEVGHSDEVMEAARAVCPDIVVMDISLPGQGGIAATRQLHDSMPGLPIVILSMFADQEAIDAAFSAGAAGYLTKDCTTEELVDAIRCAVPPALSTASTQAPPEAKPHRGETVPRLTRRERQVLQLLADGASNDALGRSLYISAKTAKNHLAHIYAKLGVSSRTEAVAKAMRSGILDLR